MTRLRTCGLVRTVESEMSEQSLFRRSAPYKPYTGSHLCSTKKRLSVKCWGANYKISQYNISQYNICGYQNLSVSRSIKVYACEDLRNFCNHKQYVLKLALCLLFPAFSVSLGKILCCRKDIRLLGCGI